MTSYLQQTRITIVVRSIFASSMVVNHQADMGCAKALAGRLESVLKEKATAEAERDALAAKLSRTDTPLPRAIYRPDAPNPMVCPITQDLIEELVVCTVDGRCYEKNAIETWLSHHLFSPITKQYIDAGSLRNASSLNSFIQQTASENKKNAVRVDELLILLDSANQRVASLTEQLDRPSPESTAPSERSVDGFNGHTDPSGLRPITPPSFYIYPRSAKRDGAAAASSGNLRAYRARMMTERLE